MKNVDGLLRRLESNQVRHRTPVLLAGIFVLVFAFGVGLTPVNAGPGPSTMAISASQTVERAPSSDVAGADAESGSGALALGDRVWEDRNRNGEQDPNEPGLAGIVVALERAAADGHRREVDRTITDIDGHYSFENLTAAWYGIRVMAPAGWRASTPGAVPADPVSDDAAIGTRTGTVVATDARFVAEDEATDDVDVGIYLPDAAIRVDTRAGEPDEWVLDVRNDGPEDDPGPLVVSSPVPAHLEASEASGDGWDCAITDEPIAPVDPDDDSDHQMQVLSCLRSEGLVDGATASITVTGRALGSTAPAEAPASGVLANVVDRVDDDQLSGVGELAAAPRFVDPVTTAPTRLPRMIIALFAASAAVFAISRGAWRPGAIEHL